MLFSTDSHSLNHFHREVHQARPGAGTDRAAAAAGRKEDFSAHEQLVGVHKQRHVVPLSKRSVRVFVFLLCLVNNPGTDFHLSSPLFDFFRDCVADWTDLFDLVIVGANKPAFLTNDALNLFRVDRSDADVLISPRSTLKTVVETNRNLLNDHGV